MQYPIIDAFAEAYINNGWTGANIFSLSSNIWDEIWEVGTIGANGENLVSTTSIRSKNYIPVQPNETYYIFCDSGMFIWGYDEDKTYIQRVPNTNAVSNLVITIPEGIYYIRFRLRDSYGTIYNNNISINHPSTITTYEPYVPPTTDIKNRLKLPLPHYFPHPVIDALQAAAAGTQTAEQTEVLRHYLTPLGIGGI